MSDRDWLKSINEEVYDDESLDEPDDEGPSQKRKRRSEKGDRIPRQSKPDEI